MRSTPLCVVNLSDLNRSTLSTFVPKLMVTAMSLKLAYFLTSVTSGVDATIAEQSDNAYYESEAGQQWLLQQHTIECGCCFDSYPLVC